MSVAQPERGPSLAPSGPSLNSTRLAPLYSASQPSSSYNYHYNHPSFSPDDKPAPPVGFRDDRPRPGAEAGFPPTINSPQNASPQLTAPAPAQSAPSPAPSASASRTWKIEEHFGYQDGCWRCQHPACVQANSPQQADSGRRLMGVYKGSQSSPSTISRRAEQHTRKHWDEEAAGAGAGKGARKRKFVGKEEGRASVRPQLAPVGMREDDVVAKVDEREAVAALIGLGSASSGDERGPISPPFDSSSSDHTSRHSTTRPESPPVALVEPVAAERVSSRAPPFPLAAVLSQDKLDRLASLQDAQLGLTEAFRSGRVSFEGWRREAQVNEVEAAILMGRAPTRIC